MYHFWLRQPQMNFASFGYTTVAKPFIPACEEANAKQRCA